MPAKSPDAALGQIKNIYAHWLQGELAAEDVLFQISDVIQNHEAVAQPEPRAPVRTVS
jgi:hypothetical protein